jgi:hypothetical protein
MTDYRESVRVADWLASRAPLPPAALAKRIADAVGDVTCSRAALPAALVDHALGLLRSIGSTRDSADDLLAADALITYAMEAAAKSCRDLDSIAADAALRISSIESPDGTG